MYPASQTGNGTAESLHRPSEELAAVLAAREERWQARLLLAQTCRVPVLSCTLRLPRTFRIEPSLCKTTRSLWDELLHSETWNVLQALFRTSADGPEGIAAIAIDECELKRRAVIFEQKHPMGWMLDLDVLSAKGHPVSRRELSPKSLSEPRRCLVCGGEAKECIVLKKHSQEETCAAISNLLKQHAQ